MRWAIDYDSYLAYRGVGISNLGGGRGWERGVRTFNCPLCGDTKDRGWANVNWRSAGCFNSGCIAEPRIYGGLLTWVQTLEGLPGKTETLYWLSIHFKSDNYVPNFTPVQIERYDDWVKLPDVRYFGHGKLDKIRQRKFELFAKRQWNFSVSQLMKMEWGYITNGFHKDRIFIPVHMNNQMVSFQTRTIVPDCVPKYRNARKGDSRDDEKAECGRAGEAILYGYDRLREGETAILVEGAADVEAHNLNPDALGSAIGALGVALTSEKIALLANKKPKAVVIGFDADAEAKIEKFIEPLFAWGFNVEIGKWVGGKDAGSGATLSRVSLDIGRRIGGNFYHDAVS